MIGWSHQRCEGMRRIMKQYQQAMTDLGISNDTLLVKIKEGDEDRRVKWCVNCQQLPKYLDAEIPAIHHLTRPPEDEDKVMDHSTDESEYYEVLDEVVENKLSEAVETMDLDDVILLDEVPEEESHGNADGLSRRPPKDSLQRSQSTSEKAE